MGSLSEKLCLTKKGSGMPGTTSYRKEGNGQACAGHTSPIPNDAFSTKELVLAAFGTLGPELPIGSVCER